MINRGSATYNNVKCSGATYEKWISFKQFPHLRDMFFAQGTQRVLLVKETPRETRIRSSRLEEEA